jgi:hypothetical protein
MEKEIFEINVGQLEKEIRLMELKEVSMKDVTAELERRSGESFSMGFETAVGRIPVKGRAFFGQNELTGLYGVDRYSVIVSESPAFIYSVCLRPSTS